MQSVHFLLCLLCLLFPLSALAVEKEREEKIYTPQTWDFEKAGGGQPANELFLEDGTKIWVHGCTIGSVVTINGSPAPAGNYKILDIDVTLKVDSEGRITEPLKKIRGKIICIENQ